MDNSYLTAKARTGLSAPVKYALKHKLITGTVLDYGCGRLADVIGLRKAGYCAEGYDPFYYPAKIRGKFSTVLCTYVLNVLSTESDQLDALQGAWDKVKKGGSLIVTVRDHKEIEREAAKGNWKRAYNGYCTGSGTHQAMLTRQTLDRLCGQLHGWSSRGQYRVKSGLTTVIHKFK